MAQRTIVQLTDDLDGKPIADTDGETVALTYRGQSYELDLSNKNLEALDKVLEKYISAARKTGSTSPKRATSGGRTRTTSDVDPKAVRAWAKANGIEVNSRGRPIADVIERYKAAGN